jgi:hypothetical protein
MLYVLDDELWNVTRHGRYKLGCNNQLLLLSLFLGYNLCNHKGVDTLGFATGNRCVDGEDVRDRVDLWVVAHKFHAYNLRLFLICRQIKQAQNGW